MRQSALSALGYIQLLSLITGVAVAVLVFFFRRLGKASWLLALYLITAALSSGSLALESGNAAWTMGAALRLSFCLLVGAAPLGVVASFAIGRENYSQILRNRRAYIALILGTAPIGILWIYSFPPVPNSLPQPLAGSLGAGGYFSALYLILVSILALANLEQTLRSAQETVRWEIKFLLLGLALDFGVVLYIASKVLLYSPELGLLSAASMRIFPVVFLISCLLMLVSWKRSTGRWKAFVSPGLVYSSITLVSVGIYLIIASIVASWIGQWTRSEISLEAVLFLLLLLVLAVVLLWTDFRQRVKHWIRRHLLAGAYDYRRYWLEASERVRSIDPPEAVADALADIVQKAIGAIDISVWLRHNEPTRLKLIGMRGDARFNPASEVFEIVERLYDIDKPTLARSLLESESKEPISSFLALTNATVLVPLQSGKRLVGLLTVGPDRSGKPYDWDALEFLGVLGRHAAGELHKSDLLSTLVEAKENEVFHAFSTFLLHDLKNFASTLSLIAKNASRYQDDLNFQREAFQSVYETSEKMKKLCNSLRAFSGTAFDKKLNNLNHIARAVADKFPGDHGGRLALDLEEIPLVTVDAEEIERVFRNLLLNAQEAIAPNGSITLRTRKLDGRVEVSVEDNGCGMKTEFIKKELFVPFRTTKSDGLGIGLYQTKKIMEAHQGTIQVESREGCGTVVRLLFPAAEE